MDSPNVLLLDEPTNDFDVETLTALEDLLDSFGGTLLVISHDRYFLERVCDRFVGLLGNGSLRDLPGGIEEYLDLRHAALNQVEVREEKSGKSNAAESRLLKKEVAKLEKQIEKIDAEIASLIKAQEDLAFDHEKLAKAMAELTIAKARKEEIDEEWLLATTKLEELEN
jgi:ATP-binding cassette subfamily F protein uup